MHFFGLVLNTEQKMFVRNIYGLESKKSLKFCLELSLKNRKQPERPYRDTQHSCRDARRAWVSNCPFCQRYRAFIGTASIVYQIRQHWSVHINRLIRRILIPLLNNRISGINNQEGMQSSQLITQKLIIKQLSPFVVPSLK